MVSALAARIDIPWQLRVPRSAIRSVERAECSPQGTRTKLFAPARRDGNALSVKGSEK